MSDHVHRCSAEGCEKFFCCEDSCIEDDQETIVYCDDHSNQPEQFVPTA